MMMVKVLAVMVVVASLVSLCSLVYVSMDAEVCLLMTARCTLPASREHPSLLAARDGEGRSCRRGTYSYIIMHLKKANTNGM